MAPTLPLNLPIAHLQKRASETGIPVWVPALLGGVIAVLIIGVIVLYNLFRRQLERLALKNSTENAPTEYNYSSNPEPTSVQPINNDGPPRGVPYFFFEDILMMDNVDAVKSGGYATVAKGRFVGIAAQQAGYQCKSETVARWHATGRFPNS